MLPFRLDGKAWQCRVMASPDAVPINFAYSAEHAEHASMR